MWVTVFVATLLIYGCCHSWKYILTWLMVELPYAVRAEDGTPVSVEVLQMAHNTSCTSLLKEELRIFELEH